MERYFIKLFFVFFLLFPSKAHAQDKHQVDSLLNIIKKSKTDTALVHRIVDLSRIYEFTKIDSALTYAKQALIIAEKVGNPKALGFANNNLGDVYWYKSDFVSSYNHYFTALSIFQKLNDTASVASCYRNIGWIYLNQFAYQKALSYFTRSLEINKQLKLKIEQEQNYNDIAIIYTNTNESEKAIENLQRSISISEELKDREGLIVNYGNIAVVYDRIGKLDMAVAYILKGLHLAELEGNKQHLCFDYCTLGEYYRKQKKYSQAIPFLLKGVRYSKETESNAVLRDCYLTLSRIYAATGNFQEAYLYADSLSFVKDRIYNEDNSRQINEVTAKYESEEKELTINSLEKDKSLSEEKFKKEKNFRIYLGIFCLLIAGTIIALYRSNKENKKRNMSLSNAYTEIEEKNKDITDSITYSKRIQEASLPPKEFLFNLFPRSFILFAPKDIVSGDFYWFAEKKGKRFIAACDCTGHGVPGALMSMIGNNLLNRIVNEKEITSPDEILNQLHIEIRRALNQHEQESRDGMDIALLVFNSETEIEFAGAQRPLWHFTTEENKSSIQEIKPNKFSIGGLQTENNRTFSKKTISLKTGDRLYIFSDGIVDQFGGPLNKKFMSKHFKELLLSLDQLPMSEQERSIAKTIKEWQGNREQVDDILVIGIKI